MRWMFVKHDPSSVPWAPSDIPDLQCWLDASDSSTITLSGNSVTFWQDKAGTYHADDAVDGTNTKITTARPTIAVADQNGLDAIAFNGQRMDHNSARNMLINRSAVMFVAVGKYGGELTAYRYLWSNMQRAVSPHWHASVLQSNPDGQGNGGFYYSVRRLQSDTYGPLISTTPNDTNWHIFIGYVDFATTGSAKFFVDGIEAPTGLKVFPGALGNTSNIPIPDDPANAFVIGAGSRTGIGLPNGSRIGELICVTKSSGTISDSDRLKLEGYLAHKWGLEGNLPVTHPYYNAPPLVG